MEALYRDRWITCTPGELVIGGYYFPLARAKRVPYPAILGVSEIPLALFRGRWRIWGTDDLRHWMHLDPGRPRKRRALVLELRGRWIRPVITPDDPDRVRAIVERHAGG